MKEVKAFLDSNILAYRFDETDLRKSKIAEQLMEKCWLGQEEFAVSLQVLGEFYEVVTKKLKSLLPKDAAKTYIDSILAFNNWKVIVPTKNTVSKAIDINIKYNVHFWDAFIAATMLENGISHIYTENINDFKKIPGIVPINPF